MEDIEMKIELLKLTVETITAILTALTLFYTVNSSGKDK